MPLTNGQFLQHRYRIIARLGQGGMGAVYRAWDARLNVSVAIKEMIPQPGLNSERLAALRQQFQQEAQVLARLDHPHLVRVTDYFQEGGNAYLVMNYVEGESLFQRIQREGALPEKQLLDYARQLMNALAYCHRQGIIHRDVKPQNVVIRSDGQVMLVDFGLVKFWDPRDPRTRTAIQAMGTPEYAPPEQYDAQMGHTDARSDVYSLGATLYHALVGQAPPTATRRIVDPEALVPVRSVNPQVSLHVEAVLMQALELRPEARFQSIKEMASALQSRTRPHDVTIKAPQPQTPPSAAPEAPPKRKSGIALGLGGVGLLVVGLLCLALAAGAVVVGLLVGGGDGGTMPIAPTSTLRVASSPRPPTVTPLATSEMSDVLLQDDFANTASGWEIGDYEGGSVGYENGAYAVSSVGKGRTMWGVANRTFDDIVIEVDTTQVAAPANNNNDYGVACRVQADGAGYYLLISGDGYHAIAKSSGSGFEWLTEWAESSVIRQGDATNHIQAICNGSYLALAVNGELLTEIKDTTYSQGDIALTATSYEDAMTEIHFDNILVQRPSE